MFEIMRSAPAEDRQGGSRKSQRKERLGSKPNPFLNFQNVAGDADDEDDDDDDGGIVARYWDMKEYCAKMLHGSGRMVSADEYLDSGDGFITAVWIHDGSKLDTEIPASQLSGKHVIRPGVAAAVEVPKPDENVGGKAPGKSAKGAGKGKKKKGKPKAKPKPKTATKKKKKK